MRKLSTISVQPRNLALIVLAAVAFAFMFGLALLLETQDARLVSLGMMALGVAGVVMLLVATLLEQRRRYVRRIQNLERKVSKQLSTLSGQLDATDARSQSSESLAARLHTLRSDHHERLEDLEGKNLYLSAVLADELAVPEDLFTSTEASQLAEKLIDKDPLSAFDLLSKNASFAAIPLSPRRKLVIRLRALGYLRKSFEVLESVAATTNTERDQQALLNRRSELELLNGLYVPKLAPGGNPVQGTPGHVLHVVGKALPRTQSGYTLRTHYSARAQEALGLTVSVVSQLGEAPELAEATAESLDGVTYHSIPGSGRTKQTLGEWLDGNVEGVLDVVRRVKPAVLHAHSDFFNAMTAQIVGDYCGIPVVYESRGFWEESWLSRVSQSQGISDWDKLSRRWGMPDAYTLRAEREVEARANAAHVFTLARVMQEHIEQQGLPGSKISLAPNAVSVEDFPVLGKDPELLKAQGIHPRALVVGYISSIVEYEGIDTLLEAFARVRGQIARDVRLLIVGDGPFLSTLKETNRQLGGEDVIFTGRVAHEDVLKYYSLIDVFVVPRRPSRVCQLVTPLKPFEAFSTGRAVIMSDVQALKEIAEESGAAALFRAGDAHSLKERLREFLLDADLREQMASRGAVWVREVRTWDANAHAYQQVYESLGVLGTQIVPGQPVVGLAQ